MLSLFNICVINCYEISFSDICSLFLSLCRHIDEIRQNKPWEKALSSVLTHLELACQAPPVFVYGKLIGYGEFHKLTHARTYLLCITV